MRSSGHLKPNLISFCKLNKIANAHITVNPGAQGSRGRHNPVSIAFPRGSLGLCNCSTLCGHGEENLCDQRTNATQQSSARAKKPPQQHKIVTTVGTNMVGGSSRVTGWGDGAQPQALIALSGLSCATQVIGRFSG